MGWSLSSFSSGDSQNLLKFTIPLFPSEATLGIYNLQFPRIEEQEDDTGVFGDEPDDDDDAPIAPSAATGKWSKQSEPAVKKKATSARAKAIKDKEMDEASASGKMSYVYDENGSGALAGLDNEMKEVAAKCKGYPKQIPACLQNLNVNRVLSGAMLGRSICKACCMGNLLFLIDK